LDHAGIKEEFLGKGGLSRVRMADDGEGAPFGDGVFDFSGDGGIGHWDIPIKEIFNEAGLAPISILKLLKTINRIIGRAL
jgi:hypothetical protein